MSAPRYSAWRFDLRVTDPYGALIGLDLNPQGGVEMIQEAASIRQAILLLILTRPGERVGRPEYGCLLHRLIFSPNDDTTAGLAIHYVRRALDLWEPRIDVLRLDARRNEESPEILDIVLDYRIRATRWTEFLTMAFDLSGGQS